MPIGNRRAPSHPNDSLASLRFRWIIDGRWKLIAPYAACALGVRIELFDLGANAHGLHQVAGEKPDVVAELSDAFDAWWRID